MRTAQTGILWRVAATRMPTKWGMFSAIGFEREVSNGSQRAETALAIVLGELTSGAPLLRIHSQCFTGEVLGSLRCDCNDQLEMAMKAIATEGRGLVIYEYQEGRGIGLMAKLQAYELQDVGIRPITRWASRPTAGISACRPRYCTTSASSVCASSQIIRARLSPWLTPALKLSRGFPAKLRLLHTRSITCRPKKRKWGTH